MGMAIQALEDMEVLVDLVALVMGAQDKDSVLDLAETLVAQVELL
jgi:hypothetical protein